MVIDISSLLWDDEQPNKDFADRILLTYMYIWVSDEVPHNNS